MEWLIAFIISVFIVFVIFIGIVIKTFLNDRFGKDDADTICCVIFTIIILTVFIRFVYL